MTKKGKNKHDDNTFYFPGQKAQSEDSARNGFEKDQPDREEEEEIGRRRGVGGGEEW